MPWVGGVAAGVGSIASAAISSGNKPAGQITQTGSSAPWDPYGSQLSNLYNWTEQGARAPGTPGALTPNYYGGETYAGLTPQGTGALNSIYGNQSAGNLVGTAGQQIGQTAGGAYTQGGTQNPFFQQAFQGVADQIRPAIDSSFESGGRYGSGSADFAKASALTNAGAQAGMANYTQERTNQLNASAQAPNLAQAQYLPAQMQLGAAQTQQADTQGQDTAAKNAYDYTSNMPYLNLQRYQGLLTNPQGGGSTMQNSPYFTPSVAQNAIGGALGGAAVGNMLNRGSTSYGGMPAQGGGMFGAGGFFGAGGTAQNYLTGYNGANSAPSALTGGVGYGMNPY